MSERTSQLLQLLAPGNFCSGEQLGQALQMSRMAVHKRINNLERLGLDIYRVPRRGYRLAEPIQLLELDKIRQQLIHKNCETHLAHITGSTNDDLRALIKSEASHKTAQLKKGTHLLAEMQTAGKGRRGKPWHSPFGNNLYVSMYWPLEQGVNAAMGLSVAIGLAIAEQLSQQGIDEVQIKWPNDVYIAGKKVAGILVELEVQAEWQGEAQALIGVGLNLDMPAEQPDIEQPFTSVQAHLAERLDRNKWAAWLIDLLYQTLQAHDEEGLAPLVTRWQKFDRFYQQPVRIIMGQHVHEGIAYGIDEMGAFLVKQAGQIKRYFGGEVSVRGD